MSYWLHALFEKTVFSNTQKFFSQRVRGILFDNPAPFLVACSFFGASLFFSAGFFVRGAPYIHILTFFPDQVGAVR